MLFSNNNNHINIELHHNCSCISLEAVHVGSNKSHQWRCASHLGKLNLLHIKEFSRAIEGESPKPHSLVEQSERWLVGRQAAIDMSE